MYNNTWQERFLGYAGKADGAKTASPAKHPLALGD